MKLERWIGLGLEELDLNGGGEKLLYDRLSGGQTCLRSTGGQRGTVLRACHSVTALLSDERITAMRMTRRDASDNLGRVRRRQSRLLRPGE
jgi:hypothetical protein